MEIQERVTRRLRAPARREQLLDTAAQLAVQDGFHLLSVQAVARRAGVTRAVIYRHFRDLDDLLDALLEREMARAHQQVQATTPADLAGDRPVELLLQGLGAFLQAVHDHPLTWRLMLMPPEGAPPALRGRVADGRQAVQRRLTRAVRPDLTGQSAQDAELTARVLTAVSDEYARLVLLDPERYPPERLLRHAQQWLTGTNHSAWTPSGKPKRQQRQDSEPPHPVLADKPA